MNEQVIETLMKSMCFSEFLDLDNININDLIFELGLFDNKKITGIENLLITEGSDGMTLIENINNPRAAKIEQFRTKSK